MSNFEKRIYLTGFMGSGKSTVGPILANVLGYAFVDLDEAIAARAGKPVVRIFAEEGEAAFRALEAMLLRETAAHEHMVYALGGGTLAAEANLRWALEHGIVVYLRVSLDQLMRRLRRGRVARPLLLDAAGRPLTAEALREKIQAMMDRRAPSYERAHIIIDIGNQRVGITVDEVMKALRQYRRRH